MFDKIKQLSKETVIYGLSNIVSRFLNFLLVPFYSHVFLRSEFGEFSLVYAYLSFLNILFIYGMDAAFMKYKSVSENEDKKRVFSTSMITVFGSSIVLALIMFLLKDGFRELIKIEIQLEQIVTYVILILFLDTLTLIPFANLRLNNRPLKFAAIKTGNIAINIALNFILILGYDYGIEAIFISNLFASAFSLLLLIPDIIKNFTFEFSTPILKKLLKFALPYLPGSLASVFVQLIDVPIIEMLAGKETLGLYRANYKLGILIMLFVSVFNYAWQPFFLNNAKEKNAKELFSNVATLFMIILGVLWIFLALFTENLATIQFYGERTILGSNYLEGLVIIPVILTSYVFYGLFVLFTPGIYIQEKTKYFPVVTGTAAIANVVVNLILVPKIGIMGAAIATLISYVTMAGGLFYFSQKFYPINYDFGKLFKIILVIFASLIMYYYLYSIEALNLFTKFLMVIGYIASFFILRIATIKEIKSLFHKINF
jgi:O-antigen/teichoic acid export membrane protein